MHDPDVLIVGGGSAGATLAARLSEDPGTRVLLIEAGPDTPPDALPADVADTFPRSSLNPDYFWPGLAASRCPGGPLYSFPQARIMGGGSSVMGMWALRGVPSDFDGWAAAGAIGWSWADVMPYFRKLEHDVDRDNSQGAENPYPVRRVPRAEWPPFALAIESAAHENGIVGIFDINEDPREGFFPMPVSQSETMRSSSAICYLTAAVRRRRNLAIMTDARVIDLRFDGLKACGAVAERAGQRHDIAAREVILSAGAIHSPSILLRAGIGPADELKRLGIEPRLDRRGVGRNLQNHPYLNIALTLPRGLRQDARLRHFAIAGVRLSSGFPGAPPADLLVFMTGRVSPRSFGTDLAMVGVALYAPYSRGAVTLKSRDVNDPPAIDFSLLQDPRDAPRILKAARFAERLLLEPRVASTYGEAYLLPPVMMLNQFNQPGLAGSLLAGAAKLALNVPAVLTRRAFNRVLKPGRWFANRHRHATLSDEEILAAAVPMGHPAATCMIGRADDPAAVVDPDCRVYGVGNLRVVDASVMPSVPSANTNLPTIMIAERAAVLIRSHQAPKEAAHSSRGGGASA